MQIVIDIPDDAQKSIENGNFGAKYTLYDICGWVMNGEQQKVGKWEFLCHQNLKCSECGYVICEDDADEYKYCPNCGAKMKEGDAE